MPYPLVNQLSMSYGLPFQYFFMLKAFTLPTNVRYFVYYQNFFLEIMQNISIYVIIKGQKPSFMNNRCSLYWRGLNMSYGHYKARILWGIRVVGYEIFLSLN